MRSEFRVLPIFMLLVITACTNKGSYNPLIDRSQRFRQTPSEIDEFSQKAFDIVREQNGIVIDGVDYRLVNQIGARIAGQLIGNDLNWRFYLFHEEEATAFALSDGRVLVSTGIFDHFDEGEIAAVIGHEIAHIILQHRREWRAKRRLTAAVRAHRMTTEFEADDIGTLYMARAGFDPRASVRLWEKMKELKRAKGRPTASYFTHPRDDRRIERLQAKMDVYLAEYKTGFN